MEDWESKIEVGRLGLEDWDWKWKVGSGRLVVADLTVEQSS